MSDTVPLSDTSADDPRQAAVRAHAYRQSIGRFDAGGPQLGPIAEEAGVAPPPPSRRPASARRVRWPWRLPLHLDPLVAPSARGRGLAARAGTAERPLDLRRLHALLGYGHGLLRYEWMHHWGYHRAAPSARSLYPTDVHLVTRRPILEHGVETGAARYRLAAGVYVHEVFEQALLRLPTDARERDELLDEVGADTVLAVTSCFGRTAYKYGDFAYRLCCQEAGLSAGNLLLVAEALGLRARLRLRFVDGRVEQALGLETPHEGAMALLALDAAEPESTKPGESPKTSESIDLSDRPARHRGAAALDPAYYADLVRIHAAGRHEADATSAPGPGDATPLAPRHDSARPDRAHTSVEQVPLAAAAPWPDRDFAAIARRRDAGQGVYLTARPEPLPAGVFRRLVDSFTTLADELCADEPCADEPCADEPRTGEPAFTLHLVALRVEGLEPGVYRVAPDGDALETLGDPGTRLQDLAARLQATYTQHNVNLHDVPVCFFPVGDYDRWLARFGARAYRMANLELGAQVQRLGLTAAAYDLSLRVSDSIHEPRAAELLGLDPPAQALLHAVAFRPGLGHRHRTLLQP